MSIARAKKFINRGQVDNELRRELNGADTMSDIETILEKHDLLFSPGEFEEAYSNLLTLCPTEDAANQLKEYKMWWDFLTGYLYSTENNIDFSTACASSSSCSAGTCSGCY